MSWRIKEVDPKFIKFELIFTNPWAVSTNPLDQDQVEMEIL